jgi:acyl-CoA synthetase (AMP-forming)/AMP-acid ligase II
VEYLVSRDDDHHPIHLACSLPGSRIAVCDSFKEQEFHSAATDADRMAMMLFTSGSTGEPKAVMLSHRNVLSNCDSICRFLPVDFRERAGIVVPLCHALGNSVMQTHILSGAEIVFLGDSKFPTDQIEALKESQCTSVTGVPEIFEGWLPVLRDQDLEFTALRYVAVAGGRFVAAKALEMKTRIAPAKLFLMYGQTEATARLGWLPPDELDTFADTIGQAIPGVELRVLNEAGTTETECGEPGTLFARGDNVMLGYWNDPSATNEVIINGWLKTGDRAFRRADDRLVICGRQTDEIKIQGFRFHPSEVEQVLQQELGASAVAIPFDFFGKTRLSLFVRNDPLRPMSLQQLARECRRLLPPHLVPQRLFVVADWPLNAAGKTDRRELAGRIQKRTPDFSNQASQLTGPETRNESCVV